LEEEGWSFVFISGSTIVLVAGDWLKVTCSGTDGLGTSCSGTDC